LNLAKEVKQYTEQLLQLRDKKFEWIYG